MNERRTDFELLQRFVRHGEQSAFADLVRRHLDLVFATALRKLADSHGSQEVAQNVFTALAGKAWQFAPDDSLPAWLHKTALLESKSWLRGELRRRRREQTAAELGTTMKTPDEQPAFNALVPLLDEALLSLREKDRTALLLRFYESQSLRDVGASLGVGEDTAQKRVQSALEKLSDFFQRRGFKTATVAAAMAALHHTAASASAATTSAVVSAALQAAPPALAGLTVLFARFASLTKMQTAALCVAIAAGPVAWQLREHRETETALAQTDTQLAAAQYEFNRVQTEIQRLKASAARLDDSLANARTAAARSAETEQKFAGWKERVRVRLLTADYQWPADLPFVRIPKAILPQLTVSLPITQPGVIKREARELLGLTPAERELAEAALQKHLAAMDSLMESSRYETNSRSYSSLPRDAVASQVFALPALGDAVKQSAEELQVTLQTVLGGERWPLLGEQSKSYGTHTLRRLLHLDAGDQGQEMAVSIRDQDGKLMAYYGWRTQRSSFGPRGLALELFLPGAELPFGGTLEEELHVQDFPAALTRPALAWIRQQAEARLQPKGDQ
ncbi:MAG: sigma-70 family RNA polymerase sigma factor [Verrucomicrobia bacterium]|nr:sigma-70 family RNA polymerase sigma factor [Verrucomicrobiota bacterium]